MSSRKGGESVLTTMRMTGSDSYIAAALRNGAGITDIMDGLRRHYPYATEAELNAAWSCGLRGFAAGCAQKLVGDDAAVDSRVLPPPEPKHNGYGYYCVVRYISADKPDSALAGVAIYSTELLTGRQLKESLGAAFSAFVEQPSVPCVGDVPHPPVKLHSYICYCICPETVMVS